MDYPTSHIALLRERVRCRRELMRFAAMIPKTPLPSWENIYPLVNQTVRDLHSKTLWRLPDYRHVGFSRFLRERYCNTVVT